jgi:hypothetical protein
MFDNLMRGYAAGLSWKKNTEKFREGESDQHVLIEGEKGSCEEGLRG